MNLLPRSDRAVHIAGMLAATGFAGIALFQLALAAGAPWGILAPILNFASQSQWEKPSSAPARSSSFSSARSSRTLDGVPIEPALGQLRACLLQKSLGVTCPRLPGGRTASPVSPGQLAPVSRPK